MKKSIHSLIQLYIWSIIGLVVLWNLCWCRFLISFTPVIRIYFIFTKTISTSWNLGKNNGPLHYLAISLPSRNPALSPIELLFYNMIKVFPIIVSHLVSGSFSVRDLQCVGEFLGLNLICLMSGLQKTRANITEIIKCQTN